MAAKEISSCSSELPGQNLQNNASFNDSGEDSFDMDAMLRTMKNQPICPGIIWNSPIPHVSSNDESMLDADDVDDIEFLDNSVNKNLPKHVDHNIIASTPLVGRIASNDFDFRNQGLIESSKKVLFGLSVERGCGNQTFAKNETFEIDNKKTSAKSNLTYQNEISHANTKGNTTFDVNHKNETYTFSDLSMQNSSGEDKENKPVYNSTFTLPTTNVTVDKGSGVKTALSTTHDILPGVIKVNTTFDVNRKIETCTFPELSMQNSSGEDKENKPVYNSTFTLPTTNVTVDKGSGVKTALSTTHDILPGVIKETTKQSTSDVSSISNITHDISSSSKSSQESEGGRSSSKLTVPKRVTKLAQPRMNMAARSRILAVSPSKSLDNSTSSVRSSPARSIASSTRSISAKNNKSIPKPATKKTIPRKSLLPPPTTSNLKRQGSTGLKSTSSKPSTTQPTSQLLPSKRKAPESPKRTTGQRSAKFSGTKSEDILQFKKPGLPAPSTRPAAPSITYSSRLNSATNSRSRLQKNPNAGSSKLSSTNRTSRAAEIKTKPKPPPLNEEKAKKFLQSNGNKAVALATLLDYVVNKLDGLSAPKLSNRNSELENLIQEKSKQYESSLKETEERHQQAIDALSEELIKSQQVIEETKSSHEKYIQELQISHEEELQTSRQEFEEQIQQYEENMEEKCKEQVQKLIEPYISAHAEVESLQTVLEMKNKKLHEMQTTACERTLQTDQIRKLQDKIEALQYKNEDLMMQLKEKNNDYNVVQERCSKLQQSVEDERNLNGSLNQQNEQLLYRLNSVSPSSKSFNPVFTPSPAPNNTKNHFFIPAEDTNHCQNESNTSI